MYASYPAQSNVFKKKPTIYASGQGAQYANNTSAYQTKPTIQTSGRTFLGIPEKITIGKKATTTVNPTPAVKPVSYSPAPTVKPAGSIYASGKGAQYANNTLNKPAAPSTQTAPAPSATDTYMAKLSTFGEQQKKTQQERLNANQQYIKDQYKLSNDSLDASIPEYETAFNVFRDNSKAGVEDIKASGEVQKQNTRDYYGEAQKLDAMNRNQNRSHTGRTFAALGTTESRGEGSYQQGMENIDSEFNSVTSKRLSEQAGKLTEIDAVVGKAERESIAAIQTEEAKKNTLIRQIQIAKQQNKLDEAQSLLQAYNDSQDIIDQITENLDGLKYQSELEKEKIAKESEAIKADFAGLSPEFISSGTPKNMNDMMFINKYKDTYKEMLSGATKSKTDVVGAIDRVLNGNPKGISGAWSWSGNIPVIAQATGAGQTQADWNALKAMLSLEGRQQLKGSGAISDFEAKILEQAATEGIDPSKMSEEQFISRLNDLKTRLSSGQQMSSGVIRVRDNATGQTGTISEGEFDPSIYTRI